MSKTDPINTANPAGSSDPKIGDDYIRALARAVVEFLAVNHYTGAASPYDEDAAGEHEAVTLRKQALDPTNEANKGFIYVKDVGAGKIELFYEDAAGNVKQLTAAGKLNVLGVDGVMLLTTDQTAAGVKTFSDIPILPSTNPTNDNHAVRKAYVDAQVSAVPGEFGDYTTLDSNGIALARDIVYKAECSGFVGALGAEASSGDWSITFEILAGTSNPPTTARYLFSHRLSGSGRTIAPAGSVPVAAEEYVKVRHYYGATNYSLASMWWIPFGTGGLVRQA